jgi:hypothetical protein
VPIVAIEGPYWQARLIADAFERRVEAAIRGATSVARLRALAPHLAVIDEVSQHSKHPAEAAQGAELAGASATCNLEVGYAFGTQLALREHDVHTAHLARAPRGGNLTILPARSATWNEDAEATLALLEANSRAEGASNAILLDVEYTELRTFGALLGAALKARGLESPKLIVSGIDSIRDLEAVAASPYLYGVYTFDALREVQLVSDLVALEADGLWKPHLRMARSTHDASDPGRKVLLRYFGAKGEPVADVAHATSERVQSANEFSFVERASGFSRKMRAARSMPLRSTVLRGGMRAGEAVPHKLRLEVASTNIATLDREHASGNAPTVIPFGLTQSLLTQKLERIEAKLV